MTITLETLELRPEQYHASKEAIRRMAHAKWVEAGQPQGTQFEYWLQAEREWIEHCYVPDRTTFRATPNRRCEAHCAG